MRRPREISATELAAALKSNDPPLLVDVRTEHEHTIAAIKPSLLLPLHEIEERAPELDAHKGRELVVYCHLGVRSLDGAAYLSSLGHKAVSLAGGIEAWSCEIDPKVPRY
jgi:rhodanese-related sulfurtransferase